MYSLTRSQIFAGQPYFSEPIPAQAVDIEVAKKVEKTTKVTAKATGWAYILMFVLMFFGNFAMQLLWGSIRNL